MLSLGRGHPAIWPHRLAVPTFLLASTAFNLAHRRDRGPLAALRLARARRRRARSRGRTRCKTGDEKLSFDLIVPLRDEANVIGETLRGLLRQTHSRLHIVVSLCDDDKSTIDAVRAIVRENLLTNRITIDQRSLRQPDQGAAAQPGARGVHGGRGRGDRRRGRRRRGPAGARRGPAHPGRRRRGAGRGPAHEPRASGSTSGSRCTTCSSTSSGSPAGWRSTPRPGSCRSAATPSSSAASCSSGRAAGRCRSPRTARSGCG